MADVARTQHRSTHSMRSPDPQQSNDGREVAAIVARLLLHYFAPGDLSEGERRAMAQDWVEDLVEFGPLLVRDACAEWRQMQSRKPAPSDIRKLCIERQTLRQERGQLAAPTNLNAYAQSLGYESHAARVAAHRAAAEMARYLSSPENGARLQAVADEKAGRAASTGPLRHVKRAIDEAEVLRLARVELGLELPKPEPELEWTTEDEPEDEGVGP